MGFTILCIFIIVNFQIVTQYDGQTRAPPLLLLCTFIFTLCLRATSSNNNLSNVDDILAQDFFVYAQKNWDRSEIYLGQYEGG